MNLKELLLWELKKRETRQLDLAEFLSQQFDFRKKIKRGPVIKAASEYLKQPINNDFCLYVANSLQKVNVVPIVVHHDRFYRHTNWLGKHTTRFNLSD